MFSVRFSAKIMIETFPMGNVVAFGRATHSRTLQIPALSAKKYVT
jgi:hypothetical protein